LGGILKKSTKMRRGRLALIECELLKRIFIERTEGLGGPVEDAGCCLRHTGIDVGASIANFKAMPADNDPGREFPWSESASTTNRASAAVAIVDSRSRRAIHTVRRCGGGCTRGGGR